MEFEASDPDWAYETNRRRFYQTYSLLEKVDFLSHYVTGPTKRYKGLVKFLPHKVTLNKITPKYTFGFVGDIMKMCSRELILGPALRHFFQGIDYLVGNFEGIITHRKHEVIAEQVHGQRILATLKTILPPEQIVLSYANNHSNDFGWNAYKKSHHILQKHGFQVMGRRDVPNILLEDKINIATASSWSNQPCEFIASFKQLNEAFCPSAAFNFLYPHWGYELYLYPHPSQIKVAQKLLEQWDAIIGHHSHTPQPVTAVDTSKGKKLVAYSLGNFSYGVAWKIYHKYGIVLKLEIGPNKDGVWQVGNLSWQFSLLYPPKDEKVRCELNRKCQWFDEI
ncbi:MAG: CapA family protein [Candidatus Heimdallarchaeota archaeon]